MWPSISTRYVNNTNIMNFNMKYSHTVNQLFSFLDNKENFRTYYCLLGISESRGTNLDSKVYKNTKIS